MEKHVLRKTAAMPVDYGEITSFKKIKRGVRQACMLSPDLFCNNIVMPNLDGYLGMKEGGHNVNNLRCADDTVLIAENKKT